MADKYPKRGSAKEAQSIAHKKKITVKEKLSREEFDSALNTLRGGKVKKKLVATFTFEPGWKELPEKNLLQSEADKFAEAAAKTQDELTRSVIIYGGFGYGVDALLTKEPWWKRWKFRIGMWWIDRRVALAEWIGGDYLHRYCDD